MKFLKPITEDAGDRQAEFIKHKEDREKEKEDRKSNNDEDLNLTLDRLTYEFDKIDDWKDLEEKIGDANGDDKKVILSKFDKKIKIREKIISTMRKLSSAKDDDKYNILEIIDDLKDAKSKFEKLKE